MNNYNKLQLKKSKSYCLGKAYYYALRKKKSFRLATENKELMQVMSQMGTTIMKFAREMDEKFKKERVKTNIKSRIRVEWGC